MSTSEEIVEKLREGWSLDSVKVRANTDTSEMIIDFWLRPPPMYVLKFTLPKKTPQ